MTMSGRGSYEYRYLLNSGYDAFAFDTLAVDQASSDPSESFLPMESVLPADSSDSSDFLDDVTVTETVPYLGDGTSNTIVFAESYSIESDWILI
jgi:hypothetical protein